MVSGSKKDRRVRDRIIKRIRKAYASVVDLAEVASKLNRVFPVDPREIIRDVVHWCYAGEGMLLASRLEYEAETNIIPVAVAALRKGLSRKPVTEVVHPVVSNRPVVASGHTARVAPNPRRGGPWEPLGKNLVIISRRQADEKILPAGKPGIKFRHMGVEFHWRWWIGSETARVHLVAYRP